MALSLFIYLSATAQNTPILHDYAQHGEANLSSESEFDRLANIRHAPRANDNKGCFLTKEVYGWHPAWCGTAYESYDFNLLSTVAYLGYVVNPATGDPADLFQWRSTRLVEQAHANGAAVELTVLNSGAGCARLLGNPEAMANLCDQAVALVREKDADGICLVFEGLAGAQAKAFAGFVGQLSDSLHGKIRNARLTLALPGTDAEKAFDLKALRGKVDRFVLLPFSEAGPTAKVAAAVSPMGAVEQAVEAYKARGLPLNKTLLGVSYMGYLWKTNGLEAGASALRKGKSVQVRQLDTDFRGQNAIVDSLSGATFFRMALESGNEQLWI
ncbi:MAG: glycosyl hydrolase family 18 protein, partial [Bacteroidota bacterium]